MCRSKSYGALDVFRLIAAALVIAIHTSVFTSINTELDFVVTRIFARVAVPFFFMVTGHFMMTAEPKRVIRWFRKMLCLYGGVILLYLPLGIYAGYWKGRTAGGILKMLLFDGTFYHLWYFPACILGFLIVYLGCRVMKPQIMLIISVILYAIGLLGDSYYGLTAMQPVGERVYESIFAISSYTRNGVFFAPVFMMLGSEIGQSYRREQPKRRAGVYRDRVKWAAGLLVSMSAMTAEGLWLHHMQWQRHDSMYVCLIPVMVCLYELLMRINCREHPVDRKWAMWVYMIHPIWIVVIRGAAKLLHMTALLVEQSVVFYILVVTGSFATAIMTGGVKDYVTQKKCNSNRGC